MIYLDHNATTPVDERVLQVMLPFFSRFYANPSSLYKLARLSRSAIDTAREQVAQLVNARPEQVIFTSGGTEANNLALKACLPKAKAITSAFEHPSVLQSLHNPELAVITKQGYIDPQSIIQFAQQFDLASFMLVNNETGVIQDIPSLSAIMKQQGTIVHTDAVQAAGKIPVDFQAMGVDLMSLSSHKMYGPKGCGALIASPEHINNPLLTGGGQEAGLRAGTENVPAIVGFGKAAELAHAELEQRHQHCLKLRTRLENQLHKIPGVTVFALDSERVANTVQFGLQNCVGEMLLMQLDKRGIAVSSGSACATSNWSASHVLNSMGIEEDLARSAIRVSLGQGNTEQEIDCFVQELMQIL
ncbi:MAG: cysteine desulfurase [Gammaproteobacteria bacterium]|jgi:cysteine desulfurase|nr:cysteine desulfurase [Gammaproteobacteria bacterium]MBT5222028.1 cysteine desulfurase [Gammaproteobacteria bacterium]MBT5825694.1 cysteine desulfurase [Gammaproteobacteria bacterium]MBT6419534.1 cysteine desulfurase [Gammaproteobacteria bacterium]MBT6576981.1 cysteine desulfurase [Gammaproteobacteria bacterium]